MEITFHPIGYVRNAYPENKKPHSWRGICSRIDLDPQWAPGLVRLDDFSHILVLCYLNLSPRTPPPVLVRPRGDPAMPEIGFWSTRTPHRPNPIALSLAKLVHVRDHELHVLNLDMFDGTPVIDIKPYLPLDDEDVPEIVVPKWVYQARQNRLPKTETNEKDCWHCDD